VREVSGQKATEVEAVVRRQIDADTVNHQRNLLPTEAADEDIRLVAPAVGVLHAHDPRHEVHGLVERISTNAVRIVMMSVGQGWSAMSVRSCRSVRSRW
jgi:hypothetical protein